MTNWSGFSSKELLAFLANLTMQWHVATGFENLSAYYTSGLSLGSDIQELGFAPTSAVSTAVHSFLGGECFLSTTCLWCPMHPAHHVIWLTSLPNQIYCCHGKLEWF